MTLWRAACHTQNRQDLPSRAPSDAGSKAPPESPEVPRPRPDIPRPGTPATSISGAHGPEPAAAPPDRSAAPSRPPQARSEQLATAPRHCDIPPPGTPLEYSAPQALTAALAAAPVAGDLRALAPRRSTAACRSRHRRNHTSRAVELAPAPPAPAASSVASAARPAAPGHRPVAHALPWLEPCWIPLETGLALDSVPNRDSLLS